MGWAFLAILFAVSGYVLSSGDRTERLALAALLISYLGTFAFHHLMGQRDWLVPSAGIWLSDACGFLLLFYLALREKKPWVLFLTGLQLLTILTPLVAWASSGIVSRALGITQGLWSYPQLIILMLATISRRRSEVKLSSGN